MTGVSRSADQIRGPRPWWAMAGFLSILGAGCITGGLHVHRHPLAPPVAAPPTFTTRPATPLAVVAAAAHSTPISLQIPSISLSVRLSTLGLNVDGSVQVPTDVAEPGWFRLGPSPGQIGSAVILGHVDSSQGPGVFFQLRTLLPGEQVQVSLADGAVATFAVTAVEQYSKAQFPSRLVYASQGTSELQLVTCGGTFDPQTGHYLSNVVVFSSFVSATPATVLTEATEGRRARS
jgi:hypothetical protein